MTRLSFSDDDIARTMLDLVTERGAGKTICPSEVARALGGPHPDGWGPLMTPVRRVAVALMKDGRVVIRRKGRPVDSDDFRGVYRIGPADTLSGPTGEGEDGPGNSASERPDRR
ncbi:DUF3253 domain-containing protein [uncultured Enterovirga sp.]|uniref:DUF3253 domain-containing protein n=1 Tax=uncultured Enterovirga sp. TaxID=2026352 RepID=UPI0035CCA284